MGLCEMEKLMMRNWMHRQIARLEMRYGYDASYLHDIANASPAAFLKFGLFQVMSAHRDTVPNDAWFAARLAAAMAEDCGPCTQIVIDMALEAGISGDIIAALIREDFDKAGRDAALGFRYGCAVAANTTNAGQMVEEAERRFGKRGLVALAYAVATSRVYPTVKRGLGHAKACVRLAVAGQTIEVHKTA